MREFWTTGGHGRPPLQLLLQGLLTCEAKVSKEENEGNAPEWCEDQRRNITLTLIEVILGPVFLPTVVVLNF